MTYVESLLAGYRVGVAQPVSATLEEELQALRGASSASERGLCLGSIAALLGQQTNFSTPHEPSEPSHQCRTNLIVP